ncbi:MAG: group II intron reverse transcriptase/maturase [Gemmatimonadetes bacterium]|nr:group II intron reverse transcriptase/maturase [Gemmatimonadota bacterium]
MIENADTGTGALLERVLERGNLQRALKRVRQNKGAAGVDGMTVEQLPAYLRVHWPRLREELLAGRYQPQPVRGVEIPKRQGGTRQLGIPTVLDRFLQQAVLQVLQPLFEPTFSPHSYGFRPKRSAHDAIRAAQRYVEEGRAVVVDVDLEKFFDRVNHDVLLGRLARKIEDRRLLRLLRRYLEAGMMASGVATQREEGTPQGGPLSPLLANVLLDEVDKTLEASGHAFARYADDLNVYVRSERAGERVLARLRKLFGKLRLRINEGKSAVAKVWERKFLGFTFSRPSEKSSRRLVLVAKASKEAFRQRVRRATRRVVGRSLAQAIQDLGPFLRGWSAYFRPGMHGHDLEDLDGWVRRRLRALWLKQKKRGKTIFRALRARKVPFRQCCAVAATAGHWWAGSLVANKALPKSLFHRLGLVTMAR